MTVASASEPSRNDSIEPVARDELGLAKRIRPELADEIEKLTAAGLCENTLRACRARKGI